MKKNLSTIVLVVIFFVGLSLLLYPSVSNYWNSFHQSHMIASYIEEVADMDQEKYDRLWQGAEDYNRALRDTYFHLTLSVHEHAVSCYNEDGDLICGQADFVVHTHGEDCFNKGGDLICELPEIKEHKHTAECYEEIKTLTCPLEENEEHTHTDACYTTEQVLVCDKTEAVLHRHTEDCYDENGKLICGQMEVLEHTHEDGCFTEVKKSELDAADEATPADNAAPADDADTAELNAVAELKSAVRSKPMMAAGPMKAGAANSTGIDMTDMITTVEVQRFNPDSGFWEPINDGKIKADDELRFNLIYAIPGNTLNTSNKTVSYKVPAAITLTHADAGNVYDGAGNLNGEYAIDEQGNISIAFIDEYAQKNAEGSQIYGHVWFKASVEGMTRGDDDKIHLPFTSTQEFTFDVFDTKGDLTVDKSSHNAAFSSGTVDYEIVISSTHGTSSPVILDDTMISMQVNGPVVITKNGQLLSDSDYTLSVENGAIRGELPQMDEGDVYRITYPAVTTKDLTDKVVEGKNDVTVTSTDSMGVPVVAHDSVTDVFTKKIMKKSGQPSDTEGMVDWTIVINTASPKMDIAGWTLSDTMNASGGTVNISPNPETGDESIDVKLPYTFPSGEGIVCAEMYTITYQTAGDSSTVNMATLTPPGDGNEPISTKGVVGNPNPELDKKGIAMYAAGTDSDGKLINCEWEITLDAATATVQPKSKAIRANNGSY